MKNYRDGLIQGFIHACEYIQDRIHNDFHNEETSEEIKEYIRMLMYSIENVKKNWEDMSN